MDKYKNDIELLDSILKYTYDVKYIWLAWDDLISVFEIENTYRKRKIIEAISYLIDLKLIKTRYEYIEGSYEKQEKLKLSGQGFVCLANGGVNKMFEIKE